MDVDTQKESKMKIHSGSPRSAGRRIFVPPRFVTLDFVGSSPKSVILFFMYITVHIYLERLCKHDSYHPIGCQIPGSIRIYIFHATYTEQYFLHVLQSIG